MIKSMSPLSRQGLHCEIRRLARRIVRRVQDVGGFAEVGCHALVGAFRNQPTDLSNPPTMPVVAGLVLFIVIIRHRVEFIIVVTCTKLSVDDHALSGLSATNPPISAI